MRARPARARAAPDGRAAGVGRARRGPARLAAAALALGLAAPGCDQGEPKPFPEYAAPKRRPASADASCEGVAQAWPEGRRVEGALKLRVG
ncbi:MAG TPA: hypothetical protein VFS00_01435, partial [Polyangiaceae bacterium]|nr:hypothetical protein [Polyangiaceae bacterium]